MESEIKVGEYCRTKIGYIARVTEIDNYIWFNEKINKESGLAVYELSKTECNNLVVKHSENILDLIKIGDYLNGYKVVSIDRDVLDNHTDCIELDFNNNYQYNFITTNQIETIVTKEQFESISYKVERKD